MNIYHITSRSAWNAAARSGRYTADSLASEGFIHCSTAAQVLPVARQFYPGHTGLILLVINTNRLASPVRWERAAPPPGLADSAAFPHVYGPIGLDAIAACLEFEPNEAGEFALPPLPAEDKPGSPRSSAGAP